MGKNSPKQPDPGALMNQQSALNRVNQFTPFGNIVYEGSQNIRVPGGPDIKNAPTGVRVQLSPEQQHILNQQQQAAMLLGQSGINLAHQLPQTPAPQFSVGSFRSPDAFVPSTLGPQAAFNPTFGGPQAAFAPTIAGQQAAFAPGDFEDTRRRVEQAQFQRAMSLLNPEMQRQEEALRQRLANQGLPQASRAFTSEVGRFEDTSNRAREQAALAAVLMGGEEQSRLFGQDLATFQTEAQRRAQQFGQDITGFGAEAARRQQQFGQDLAGFQTEAARRQQQFGQELATHQTQFGDALSTHQQRFNEALSMHQAQQAQRAAQLNEILARLGLSQVQMPQFANVPQVDAVHIPQQQQANMLSGLLALGGAGLGAALGGPGGGLAGAQFGFQAGAQLPGLFGV